MIKIILFSVCCVWLGLLLRGCGREYGVFVGLACGLVLAFFGMQKLEEMLVKLGELTSYMGQMGGYFPLLLKVIGITYLCEFASGICKDAGYQTLAGQIELLGKVSVMLSGLPVVFAVIDQIRGLV